MVRMIFRLFCRSSLFANRTKMKDTKQMYSIDSKTYMKKRKRLHQQIIRKFDKTDAYPKKGKKPIAILIGGGTASGKTKLRKTLVEQELKAKNISAAIVDIDEIKEHIPEYAEYKQMNPGKAAELVHKEAYDIGMKLLHQLMKKRKNFIFESTMARTRKFVTLVNDLKMLDYEVHAYIVYVPLLVMKKRAEKRAQLTGRKVPDRVIENTYKLAPKTCMAIKDRLDSFQVFDNSQGTFTLMDADNYFKLFR